MNRIQWFVLSGLFGCAIISLVFFTDHQVCVEETFGNFHDSITANSFTSDFDYNEYNLIQCAVRDELQSSGGLYWNMLWFGAIACFAMGLLELRNDSKSKKGK